METWPQVAVVGAGAVGGFFGAKLAEAGARVTLVGRPGPRSEHLETIAQNGLCVDSGNSRICPRVEVAAGVEAVAAADLVLFGVKTLDTEQATRQIAPHLKAGAIVVSLQNGVDNAERMLAAGVDAIPAVVFVAAAIEEPGRIRHRGRGDLVIGHAGRAEDVRRVSAWFEGAGVRCRISDDVEGELWTKLCLNSMGNAISAVTGASYQRIADHEPTWEVALQILREAVAVAHAAGIELDEAVVARQGLSVMRAVGDATSSTQQDLARGRRTEIDSLNGYLARRGSELGVPTPVNRAMWALVKLIEERS